MGMYLIYPLQCHLQVMNIGPQLAGGRSPVRALLVFPFPLVSMCDYWTVKKGCERRHGQSLVDRGCGRDSGTSNECKHTEVRFVYEVSLYQLQEERRLSGMCSAGPLYTVILSSNALPHWVNVPEAMLWEQLAAQNQRL